LYRTDNKKDYPAWYQGLMNTLKGSGLDRRFTKGMNYRRFGLRFEDLLVETPDVREALFRLPKDVLAARDDRIKRAMVLSSGGDELPAAQWTSEEDDLPYLAPYLSLVVQERRDREAFNPK
jgi:ubiquinol-cytochrome c reductase subunit 7